MFTEEAKTGQHNESLLSTNKKFAGMPVPYLSHSIEDILKKPSCLPERKMQKNEKNKSETTWMSNGKEDLKSTQYTGYPLLILYFTVYCISSWFSLHRTLLAFIFFLFIFSPCKTAKSNFLVFSLYFQISIITLYNNVFLPIRYSHTITTIAQLKCAVYMHYTCSILD